MNSSLISVCIPTYNGEKYLKECLDSVIGQTYSNIEIIIVDDLSSDKTVEIINDYMKRDKRIIYSQNKSNLGLVDNWNRCIELSSGEWIKYVFQDDYLNLNCLSRMMEFITPEVKIIVSDRKFIFEKEVDDYTRKLYLYNITFPHDVFRSKKPAFFDPVAIAQKISEHTSSNFIGEPTSVMFRKDVTSEIGFFNSILVQTCDLEYWLRIATNYGLFYIPETLAFFRIHGNSTSSSNRKNFKEIIDKIIIANDYLKNEKFANLRANISGFTLWKIKKMLAFRVYEVKKTLENDPGNTLLSDHFNKIKLKLPVILAFEKTSPEIKLVYYGIKLKRFFRKLRNITRSAES